MNMADDMSKRSAASGDHFPAMLGELVLFLFQNFFVEKVVWEGKC
jgi:hypothetical protein